MLVHSSLAALHIQMAMMMGRHVVALLSSALSGAGAAAGKAADGEQQQQRRRCRHDDHHSAGCCVCISRFHDGEEIRRLPCGHAFHRDCVDRWLALCRRTCPLCRLHVGGGGVAVAAAALQDEHQLSDDLVIWFSSLFVAGL